MVESIWLNLFVFESILVVLCVFSTFKQLEKPFQGIPDSLFSGFTPNLASEKNCYPSGCKDAGFVLMTICAKACLPMIDLHSAAKKEMSEINKNYV